MRSNNFFLYVLGIGFLALAKAKQVLFRCSSPKPFDISDTERCIDYDIHVVEKWLFHLNKYTHNPNFHVGKNVLELGPGSDLGVGIYLLSKGCSKYNAIDVNNLMKKTPDSFYEEFLDYLEGENKHADTNFLKTQLEQIKTGKPSRLNFVVSSDFDIVSAFKKSSVDLVFSQAAFEHFDDIDTTILKLKTVCKPGAILVAEIDLKAHSRWIRDKDPNSIYRYPNWLYNKFWFRGIPNRVRPYQYKETLERFGWKDISITPLTKFDNKKDSNYYSGIHKNFADKKNQMDYLTIMLCARNG